jgi:hypothetical protein
MGKCHDVCGQVRGCHLCVALLQKENAKDQSKGQGFVYPTLQRHDADQEQKMSTQKIITHRTLLMAISLRILVSRQMRPKDYWLKLTWP